MSDLNTDADTAAMTNASTWDGAAVRASLAEHFGHDQFLPGQEDVICQLMNGRSAAALFPTGGGKSICYQLPAVLLPGLTLVVSPLIALMKDQIDALTRRGVLARRLDSTLSIDEYREVMERTRGGDLRLLYVAPERFNNERFRDAILRTQISLFAVDEAHCISEWGHNFRPDYLKLAAFAKQCSAERVLALTATATAKVAEDIGRAFEIAPESIVRTEFYRPNLELRFAVSSPAQRDQQLIEMLNARPPGSSIVYVTQQLTAEKLAERLQAAGFASRAYHAGMKDDARAEVQDEFLQSDDRIVVATIAFGMGIDKSNIRNVCHYNLPKSLENYAQEIGRAGRDGLPSVCQMLVCQEDLNILENFVYGDTPTRENLEGLLRQIFQGSTEFDVSHAQLSNDNDIRLLVARTVLTYLELQGYLRGGTPFYSLYKFKPLMPSGEILNRFEGERREFLAAVFRRATPGRIWMQLDLDDCAHRLGQPRERIVRALDYLGEQEMMEIAAQGVRHRYTRLREVTDISQLLDQISEQLTDHETRQIARLQQILELVELDGCQVSFLSDYFGQQLDNNCGHCQWCQSNQVPIQVPQRERPTPDNATLKAALELRRENAKALSSPRAVTRMLVGVTSPGLTRARLSRHQLFGKLSHIPFQDVMQAVEALISGSADTR